MSVLHACRLQQECVGQASQGLKQTNADGCMVHFSTCSLLALNKTKHSMLRIANRELTAYLVQFSTTKRLFELDEVRL
jgi:hypothetical protein